LLHIKSTKPTVAKSHTEALPHQHRRLRDVEKGTAPCKIDLQGAFCGCLCGFI
jgi:hypothetical protein